MIKDYQKLGIKNYANNGEELAIEVNYNDYARKNELIKLTIDEKTVIVKRDHLKAILFLVGSDEDKIDLIDTITQKITYQPVVVELIATQDIKKGGKIKTMVDFPKSISKVRV